MPASTGYEPCSEGHAACGCVPLQRGCCLNCPLTACLLDQFSGHLVAKSRGARIAELRARGVEPTAIRSLLGLSRVQYHRAVRALAAPVALLDDATPAENDRRLVPAGTRTQRITTVSNVTKIRGAAVSA